MPTALVSHKVGEVSLLTEQLARCASLRLAGGFVRPNFGSACADSGRLQMDSIGGADTEIPSEAAIVGHGPRSIGETALEVLNRAPEWLRHDLAAKDQPTRVRAEETLAAMISAAWSEADADDSIAA
jgi:hypothetical protein